MPITTSNDVLRARSSQNTVTASTTFTAADAGKEYNIATDALVMTLPLIDANNIGMTFTFRNTGADGNNLITLAPNAADGFNGSIANAAALSKADNLPSSKLIELKRNSGCE